jgi:hypothetical protein
MRHRVPKKKIEASGYKKRWEIEREKRKEINQIKRRQNVLI